MQPEPFLSIPLGQVILGLVLVMSLLGLGIFLALRRRQPRPRFDVSIISPVLQDLPWAAAIVAASGRILACNENAKSQLGAGEGERLPAVLADVARRVARTGISEAASVSRKGKSRMQQIQASPMGRGKKSGPVLLLLPELTAGDENQAQSRRLLGGLSHELRTPLTAITGHLEILQSSTPEEVQLRARSFRFISAEVSRLTRLVDDLLQVSRLENAPLNLGPVNPRSVAEEAISGLYNQAEQKRIGLVLKAPANLPRVLGDPDRLRQVLINLLDNAIKFAPEDGSAEIALSPVQGGVKFSVSDSGPGIPPNDRAHVFDPFFRGSRPKFRVAKGAGLGLTIVKGILDQHGSQISLESEVGKGTRFSFVLKSA